MRPKTIIILSLLLILPACIPISCTPPTINVGCTEAELITAIDDANKGAGHNTLILEEDCVYEISAVDNFITDEEGFVSEGGTGLPPIFTPITIEGNNATIQRQAGAPDFRILFIASTGDLTLNDLIYHTGEAEEHFLSFDTPGDKLAGFLRLSLPGDNSPHTGLTDLEGAALIREVHVYGQSIEVGDSQTGAAQHIGLGTRLLQKAEEVARQKGFKRMAVIAAVGTREYYANRGFEIGERYMVKSLEG